MQWKKITKKKIFCEMDKGADLEIKRKYNHHNYIEFYTSNLLGPIRIRIRNKSKG